LGSISSPSPGWWQPLAELRQSERNLLLACRNFVEFRITLYRASAEGSETLREEKDMAIKQETASAK